MSSTQDKSRKAKLQIILSIINKANRQVPTQDKSRKLELFSASPGIRQYKLPIKLIRSHVSTPSKSSKLELPFVWSRIRQYKLPTKSFKYRAQMIKVEKLRIFWFFSDLNKINFQ